MSDDGRKELRGLMILTVIALIAWALFGFWITLALVTWTFKWAYYGSLAQEAKGRRLTGGESARLFVLWPLALLMRGRV